MNSKLAAFTKWAVWDVRHVWVCILTTLIALAAATLLGPSEQSVRLAGLFLQLAGILTVGWGIYETRGFVGLKPLFVTLREWWERCPLLRRSVTLSESGSAISILGGSAHGYTSVPVKFDTPTEEQIRALARNIDLIHERITAVHSALTTEDKAIRDAVNQQARQIADVGSQFRDHVKQYGTSGLHIFCYRRGLALFRRRVGNSKRRGRKAPAMTPNPSLKLTRYGRLCEPGPRQSYYLRVPGSQSLPPRAA